ncbi:MAG TPA: hypothetical protein VF582_01705 [Allosphingosinicella sp.]|jgi:hypothetical protein
MLNSLIAAALFASAPASGVQVDVGRANWKAMPALKAAPRALPTSAMVEHVEDLLRSGDCRLAGQAANRFDFTVPYAALVEPDGTLRQVVVAETGCEKLETFVGLVVLQLAKEGDFSQTGEPKARWYSSEINFNLQ